VLPDVTDCCRLILLRHPELTPSASSTVVGSGDADLSRRGKERVLQWMDLLQDVELDAVVCADQAQAAKPAAGLARAKGVEPREDSHWRDQNMGRWQGRTWDDVVSEDQADVTDFFQRYTEAVPPDGESLGQAVERAIEWWTETAPRQAGKTIAVVAAGSMISGFAVAMLGLRLSRLLSLSLPHGGIGVLDVYENGVRLSGWNVDALG